MKKMIFTLIALTGVSSQVFAYTYTVKNKTGKAIFVQIKPSPTSSTEGSVGFVKSDPNQSAEIKLSGWESGLCLAADSVSVASLDASSAEIVDKYYGVDFTSLAPTEATAALNEMTSITLKAMQMLQKATLAELKDLQMAALVGSFVGLGIYAAVDFCGSKTIEIYVSGNNYYWGIE